MRMFCGCRNLESVLKAPCSPGTFILSHLFPCLQHLIIFMAVAVPSTHLVFFPSPDGLEQYMLLLFFSEVCPWVSLTRLYTKAKVCFLQASLLFTERSKITTSQLFPYNMENYSKAPEGLVGWAEQSSLVFQAWLFQHSFKFSYLPGIKCIIGLESNVLYLSCLKAYCTVVMSVFLLVCLIACWWKSSLQPPTSHFWHQKI